ncbi:hypothetical protein FDECE_11801 [Fusarium decemcellulare]|nr:hypothetical protein FDECE_11801 [Fusarium decemcellulare]
MGILCAIRIAQVLRLQYIGYDTTALVSAGSLALARLAATAGFVAATAADPVRGSASVRAEAHTGAGRFFRQYLAGGVSFKDLGGNTQFFGDCGRTLDNRLQEVNPSSHSILPAQITQNVERLELDEPVMLHQEDNDDSRTRNELLVQFNQVKQIVKRSRRCKIDMGHEAKWNYAVHGHDLRFAIGDNLPRELRDEKWHIASPSMIDVYCNDDGIVAIKPHPLLSTYRESRQVYASGATYLLGQSILTTILLHVDRDFFHVHGLEDTADSVACTTVERLRNIILLRPGRHLVDQLLRHDIPELRVCLAEAPEHRLLAAASDFRRSCPICPCKVWPWDFYWLYAPWHVPPTVYGREKNYDPDSQPCPGCTWAKNFAKAGIIDHIINLHDFHATIDSSL